MNAVFLADVSFPGLSGWDMRRLSEANREPQARVESRRQEAQRLELERQLDRDAA